MEKRFFNRKNFKKVIFATVYSFIFTSFFVISAYSLSFQSEFDKSLYSNVIRFHIIADSDSDYDQQAKNKIRDEILPYISSITEKAKDVCSAENLLKDNLHLIENELKFAITRLGYNYKANVQLSKEMYPVRRYGTFTFPAGTYTSLRISLGSANGKNFWCVVYPSVCTNLCTSTEKVYTKLSQAGLSPDAAYAICEEDDKTIFTFYFLELMQNILNKKS